ncbi:1,4-dihydroxy-2-naphthoyl-CoA synthase [Baekduia alba]|uniref:enoyl-CoA hydratase-related protein n=1 Tax=Baekduia alba TaxID=2997333 RepID=UPI0023426342|nr:enoyl-CoA hydratase-related protein [Baekduia alba]WCB93284.1 1,4-dihydroxy-2-naphthoyl-CoA synthase [Baekduia alba]
MGTIVTERLGDVARIALDRPEKLNSLALPVRQALLDALRAAAHDDTVRAVILTGTGRAFCSGQDLGAAEEIVMSDKGFFACAFVRVGLAPDDVAAAILDGLASDAFLILPHPEALTFMQRKATSCDRWRAGMRRLQGQVA